MNENQAPAEGAPEACLKVVKGELCYRSKDDDQSFGMWVPVTPDADLGFANGTVFVASQAQPKGPPADPRFSWMDFQQIGELPAVDEAIRNLLIDQTEDNGVCMIRAICEAAADRLVALAAAQAPAVAHELTPAQKDRYKFMTDVGERLKYEAWQAAEGHPVRLEGDGTYSGHLTAQHDWYIWRNAAAASKPPVQGKAMTTKHADCTPACQGNLWECMKYGCHRLKTGAEGAQS